MMGHKSFSSFLGVALVGVLAAHASCRSVVPTEQIVARVYDDATQPAFDILQEDVMNAFSMEGVGGAAVTVGFIARPRLGPVPDRTQWMEVVGVTFTAEGEESTLISSTSIPWDERLSATFLSQDLYAFDQVHLVHRVEQGSRKRLMTVAAPQVAPGGGFTQPEESATVCVISDGAGNGTDCTVQYTDSEGTHTYEISATPDLAATPPKVKNVRVILENISGLVTTGDQCKMSDTCGDHEQD